MIILEKNDETNDFIDNIDFIAKANEMKITEMELYEICVSKAKELNISIEEYIDSIM